MRKSLFELLIWTPEYFCDPKNPKMICSSTILRKTTILQENLNRFEDRWRKEEPHTVLVSEWSLCLSIPPSTVYNEVWWTGQGHLKVGRFTVSDLSQVGFSPLSILPGAFFFFFVQQFCTFILLSLNSLSSTYNKRQTYTSVVLQLSNISKQKQIFILSETYL